MASKSPDKFMYETFRKREKELSHSSDFLKPGNFNLMVRFKDPVYKRANAVYQSMTTGSIAQYQKESILKSPKSMSKPFSSKVTFLMHSVHKKELAINLEESGLKKYFALKLHERMLEPAVVSSIDSEWIYPGHRIKTALHQQRPEKSKKNVLLPWSLTLTHRYQLKRKINSGFHYDLQVENQLSGKKNLNSSVLALCLNPITHLSYGVVLSTRLDYQPFSYKLNELSFFLKKSAILSSLMIQQKGSGSKAKSTTVFSNHLTLHKTNIALKLKYTIDAKNIGKADWRLAFGHRFLKNYSFSTKVSSKKKLNCALKYELGKNFKITLAGTIFPKDIAGLLHDKQADIVEPKSDRHFLSPLSLHVKFTI